MSANRIVLIDPVPIFTLLEAVHYQMISLLQINKRSNQSTIPPVHLGSQELLRLAIQLI